MPKKTKKTTATKKKVTVQKKAASTQNPYMLGAYALFSAAMVYAFGSWAIDSGSLWNYLFAYVAIYFTVSYTRRFIQALRHVNNDKKRKATRAKK